MLLRFTQILFILFSTVSIFAQNSNWNVTFKGDEAIVENQGQFDRRGWQDDDSILFGLKMGSVFTYFTQNTVTYRIEKFKKEYGKHDNKLDNNTKRVLQSEIINVEFLNANPNATIEPLQVVGFALTIIKTKTIIQI